MIRLEYLIRCSFTLGRLYHSRGTLCTMGRPCPCLLGPRSLYHSRGTLCTMGGLCPCLLGPRSLYHSRGTLCTMGRLCPCLLWPRSLCLLWMSTTITGGHYRATILFQGDTMGRLSIPRGLWGDYTISGGHTVVTIPFQEDTETTITFKGDTMGQPCPCLLWFLPLWLYMFCFYVIF